MCLFVFLCVRESKRERETAYSLKSLIARLLGSIIGESSTMHTPPIDSLPYMLNRISSVDSYLWER